MPISRALIASLLVLVTGCVSDRAQRAEMERRATAASERGDWLAAGELWHQLWMAGDSREPRHGWELARALYRQGDTGGAAKVIEASLRVAPQDANLLELLADVHLAEGRTADAAAAYERVLAADPARARAWQRLGELRLRTGDTAGAIDALQRAARLAPHERGIHLLVADAAERAGDGASTLHALASAIQAGEGSPAVLTRAGILGAERALSGTEPNLAVLAREWLSEAVALDPQRVEAWLWLGRIARARLEPERAIECLSRAVELEPTHAAALTELAEVYAAEHAPERAAEMATRALALDPDPALRARLEVLAPPPIDAESEAGPEADAGEAATHDDPAIDTGSSEDGAAAIDAARPDER